MHHYPNALHVSDVAIELLKPYKRNARSHSKNKIVEIAASTKRWGFNNPILIDAENVVRAGHGRLEAAKLCGLKSVPAIRLGHMTSSDLRAYALADNRLAEKAGWDNKILALEFKELQLSVPDLDLTLTGFETAEIDLIIEQNAEPLSAAEDPVEPILDLPVISQADDLWELGAHRIYCGNSLDATSYRLLLQGETADIVFTDPPYNVPISGHVSGKGAVTHREFAMASGEMNDPEFRSFLRSTVSLLVRHSKAGSLHYVCMDWRHALPLLDVGTEFYELKNMCVWVKDNGGMGSLYRNQHELVMVFKKPGGHHQNNIQLGRFGRNRTNVWSHPGANSFSRQGEEGNLLAIHPTVKPVQLVADALLDCTARGDIVLDAFLGSGSTLIAAERVGRRCRGIEMDPRYVDAAIRRWQRHTGDHAIHGQSRARFEDLEAAHHVQ